MVSIFVNFQYYRIEEARRAIKRPTEHDRDRYSELERSKRSTSDRHFEAPPPPPRFDTSINR